MGGMVVLEWSFAIALGVYAFDVGGAALVGVAGSCGCSPALSWGPLVAS